MPEPLPILAELRADLDAAFRAAPTPRRTRRRWLLPAGGFAAAGAAAAAIALTSGVDSGQVAPPPATAAEALRRVAAVAEHTAAPVPRDDQYYYVRSTGSTSAMPAGVGQPGAATRIVQEQRLWTSIARRGLNETHVTTIEPLSRRDVGKPAEPDAFAPRTDSMPLDAQHHYFIGAERLTRAQLLAYPVDPRQISERLLANVGTRGNSPEGEVFTELGDALRGVPAPAPVRAGLYRALALVPGVDLAGQVRDRAGRTGLAVAYGERGLRQELVFDPATSEMLAERLIVVDPRRAEIDEPAGTLLHDTVYLQRAVTDELKPPPR
jgi:hypothetical protein